jgi:hypothetical protein
MEDRSRNPQELWEQLLSREPERVRAAFAGLDKSAKRAVMVHLGRMASELGWQPEQRASAEVALRTLVGQKVPKEPNEPEEPEGSKG